MINGNGRHANLQSLSSYFLEYRIQTFTISSGQEYPFVVTPVIRAITYYDRRYWPQETCQLSIRGCYLSLRVFIRPLAIEYDTPRWLLWIWDWREGIEVAVSGCVYMNTDISFDISKNRPSTDRSNVLGQGVFFS